MKAWPVREDLKESLMKSHFIIDKDSYSPRPFSNLAYKPCSSWPVEKICLKFTIWSSADRRVCDNRVWIANRAVKQISSKALVSEIPLIAERPGCVYGPGWSIGWWQKRISRIESCLRNFSDIKLFFLYLNLVCL